MKKVITFGEVLLRLASPGYTRLFQKDSFDVSFCGGEANVAVSLALFGLNSVFVTKLPDSDVGRAAARSMAYFGVSTELIKYGSGRMGLYYLEKGASQRPSKVIYDREFSAVSLANPDEFDWNSIFEEGDWFHFTGINPALSHNMIEISQRAIQSAKKHGLIVSCDLNYRKKLWSSERAQVVMPQLMPYVDVCIANEEDAAMTLGIKTEASDVENGIINIDDYKVVATKINRKYGCKYVAFTMRESISASQNGWSALLYDAVNSQFYCSKKYSIQLVDRVGGGDSFAAGLIYGLQCIEDKQKVIDFAVAASCLKQTMEGDYNRTSIEEVWTLVNSAGTGRVSR